MKEVYYSEYLQLNKILNAQQPESDLVNVEAHDEMLFIIVHQAYELWFKQILHELYSVRKILGNPTVNDNEAGIQQVAHRVGRVITILHLLVEQINTIETMTPMDFLDFRDLLRPASGFQSYQFKMVEAILGLRQEMRHGQKFYLSHLKKEDIEKVSTIESEPTILELVNNWLERMPFLSEVHWNVDTGSLGENLIKNHPFWAEYKQRLDNSLTGVNEKSTLERFEQVCFDEAFNANRKLSCKANQNALFIMLYRDYPLLYLPYRLLQMLLEVDEMMATWRFRHINMVHRVIGTRVGTGGSTGKNYLTESLNKHYIFSEIAELTSFLIERKNLPVLNDNLKRLLGFEYR